MTDANTSSPLNTRSNASKAQTAAALIGQKVTYTDVAGTTHTGTVTGTTLGQQVPNLTVDGQVVSLDDVTAVGTVSSSG